MTDTRGYNLDVQATLDFALSLPTDKSGFTQAKQITPAVLLRTRVKNEVDESGNSSGTMNFASYNEIVITIDQDYQCSFSNIPPNSVNFLHVIKGATNVFTPYNPVTGTVVIDSYQQGLTHLIYRITSNTTTGGYVSLIIEPIVTNVAGGKTIVAFDASPLATITSFNYFKYYIDHSLCSFETEMTLEASTGSYFLAIAIDGWNITKLNAANYAACASHCFVNTTFVPTSAKIQETFLRIDFATAFSLGDTILITCSGSFQIT